MTKKANYLDQYLFKGLKNLNKKGDFGPETIKYFSQSDFAIILTRVQRLGLGIYGIEAWTGKAEVYLGCEVVEEYSNDPTDPEWYRKAYKKLKGEGEDTPLFNASYYVPEEFIMAFKTFV